MEISSVDNQMFDPAAMEQMRQARFNRDDADGNGALDAAELGAMSEHTGMSIDEILSEVDTDEDGLVTQDELEQMKPLGPPPGKRGGRMGGALDDESVDLLLEALQQYKTSSDDDDDEQTDLLIQHLQNIRQDAPYGYGLPSGLFVNQTG